MKKKKILVLVVCIVLLINQIIVFGANNRSSNTNTKKQFTIWYPIFFAEAARVIKDFGNNPTWQEIFRRTGVILKFIHPPFGQEQEHFNLMIASKDLPDMIFANQTSGYVYPGGWEKAVTDNIIVNITNYIKKYALNYYNFIKSNEEIWRDIVTDKGDILGFAQIATSKQPPWYGPVVRKDWLDELGLKEPITYDDWYKMLKSFKEKKKAQAPLMLNYTGFEWFDVFNAGFDVASGFYQVNKKVKYGPLEKGYKEYITLMNKWYKEGLIDKDFYTRRQGAPDSYLTTGKAGAWSTGYVLLNYYKLMSKDKKYKLTAVPLPVKKKGQKLHLGQYNSYATKNWQVVITTTCKDIVDAVKFWDYFYTKEGELISNYGIEGKTFTYVKGKPQLTKVITNNPQGLSIAGALTVYVIQSTANKYHWEREWVNLTQEEGNAPYIWKSNTDFAYIMPPITMTTEEGNKYAKIMSDINTYVQETTVKFIIGAIPLSRYNSFVKQIKAMGIDEMIKIQQAALDRYYKRKLK